jgi:uncharacterized membrane protein
MMLFSPMIPSKENYTVGSSSSRDKIPRRREKMPQDRTRKIVTAGVLAAIACILGLTHWGFIPWFSGASLTIMHVPVIIGAVLEGPVVGMVIGLIFGLFSMLQAAIAPTGPTDVWFTNPLVSVLPRILIGLFAWLVYKALSKWQVPALITAGIVGSLTNTVLVLGMIGALGLLPWAVLPPIVLINGLPEAVLAAILTLVIVAAWKRIAIGKRKGSNLEKKD